MRRKGYLLIVISIFLWMCTIDCAYSFVRYDGTYKGEVIDADTREPIEGVVVLGVWDREQPTPAGAVHKFYDTKETVTNKNGDFEIPGVGLVLWLWPLPGIAPMDVLIFKAGYEHIGMGTWSGLKGHGFKGYEESYDPVKKVKIRREVYDPIREVKFEDGKAIIPLKKLTMEERRKNIPPLPPGEAPYEKIKLMFQLMLSMGGSDEITEEEIEQMKQEDLLQTLLADVKKSHPIMEKVLIAERDQFLAAKISSAPGKRIVAVVGAGHGPGIKKHLATGTSIDTTPLTDIPPAGKIGKVLKWLIPGAIILLMAVGFFMKGADAGTDMIWLWIAANGIFAGIGAIVALAHPYTIISAIVAAPITSLNPMIAAGWVSGLVEAVSRKPKVRDLESIPEDILSIKGFWRNNVTRILLVVVFTNLGSTIGTMTAIPLMLRVMH